MRFCTFEVFVAWSLLLPLSVAGQTSSPSLRDPHELLQRALANEKKLAKR